MPGARIRLEAPIDSLLFPGKQTLKLRLTNGRRSMVTKDFELATAFDDFPALASQMAFLGDQVSAQPSQIAIGTVAGTDRTCALKFMNNSKSLQTVRLLPIDLAGSPMVGLRLTDKPIELKPGRNKTVRLSLNSREIKQAVFGHVRVEVDSEQGGLRTQNLPVAMLYGEPPVANIDFGELQSIEESGRTEFRMLVQNNGSGHTPVHVGLQISAGAGHAIQLADGYGQWLEPGNSRELRFAPDGPLAEGRYQLQLNMFTAPGGEPETRTLNVQLPVSSADSPTADAAL